jgi:PIN domain nuclease of toxin-antitoxin system
MAHSRCAGGSVVASDLTIPAHGSSPPNVALHAGGYRQAHRDPFDRLLAAQAEPKGLHLVSLDPALATIPCRLLW